MLVAATVGTLLWVAADGLVSAESSDPTTTTEPSTTTSTLLPPLTTSSTVPPTSSTTVPATTTTTTTPPVTTQPPLTSAPGTSGPVTTLPPVGGPVEVVPERTTTTAPPRDGDAGLSMGTIVGLLMTGLLIAAAGLVWITWRLWTNTRPVPPTGAVVLPPWWRRMADWLRI